MKRTLTESGRLHGLIRGKAADAGFGRLAADKLPGTSPSLTAGAPRGGVTTAAGYLKHEERTMAYGKSQLTRPQVVRLELHPPGDAAAKLLRYVGEQLRRVANVTVRQWLRYHEDHGTAERMAAREAVCPCPPDFCRDVYRATQDAAGDVQCATVLAAQKWLVQTIAKQKSPRVNEKRWRRVLRCDESHWSFGEPLPIRLWNGNAKFERCGDDVRLVVRLDRRRVEGKKNAVSTPLELRIVRPTGGRRSEDYREHYAAVCEIADGRRKLAQSQLFFERGKWFVALTVEGPKPEPTAVRDAGQVLYIRPGSVDPLRFRCGGKSGGFGGDELLDRLSRTRAAVEEGRRRWRDSHPQRPLTDGVAVHLAWKWKHQAAAVCDLLVTEVVTAMRNRAIGRVVWLDGNNRRAALATAGKMSERGAEIFPFERLRRTAEKRLGELGVEVVGRANFRSVKRRSADARKRRTAASGEVAGKSREALAAERA